MPSVYEQSEGGGADENEPATGVRPPFAETQQVGAVAAGAAGISGLRLLRCTAIWCPSCPFHLRCLLLQTVPETPSPETLAVNKPDLRRAAMAAAAGRNVDEDSPAKGRMAKVARTAMGPPGAAATAGSAYLSVCHQVSRQALGMLAAPAGRSLWRVAY
jgi:hypothetical protein